MVKNLFFIFFLCLLTFKVEATSKSIISLSLNSKTAKELLKVVDASTLVLIEINDVILAPKSKMFIKRPSNPDSNFVMSLVQGKNAQNYAPIIADFLSKKEDILVEPEWPDFIKELQKKSPYVLGLYSTCPRLVVPLLQDIQNRTYDKLKNFDIEFTQKILGKDRFVILKEEVSPEYYKGILFTGTSNAKNTFYEFLRMTSINPKNIIVISSDPASIKNIYAPLKPLNFNFYGLYYAKIYNMEARPNPQIVALQKNMLLQGRWMEDDEAAQMLGSGKAAN